MNNCTTGMDHNVDVDTDVDTLWHTE